MPLLEHLRELRVRLIRAVIAVAVGLRRLSYIFADHLFAWLTLPMREVGGGKLLLIGTGVGEAFFTKIKVALVAGLFIASPAMFYEVWKFIAPGLLESERRMAFAVRRSARACSSRWAAISAGRWCSRSATHSSSLSTPDRGHADHPDQRVPGVLGQADAGVRDHLRDADFRVFPDSARNHRLPHDADVISATRSSASSWSRRR